MFKCEALLDDISYLSDLGSTPVYSLLARTSYPSSWSPRSDICCGSCFTAMLGARKSLCSCRTRRIVEGEELKTEMKSNI